MHPFFHTSCLPRLSGGSRLALLWLLLLSIRFGATAQTPGWDWYVRAGGPVQEYGKAISRDPHSGDLLVAGSFNVNTTAVGSALFENQTLNSAGAGDILLARYSATGRLRWAKSAGGSGDDGAQAVVVDPASGHILLTGEYSDRAVFGPDTLPTATGQDFYLACYDSTGLLLWTRSGGGPGYTAGRTLSVDSLGNIYVGGVYESSLTLPGTALAVTEPGKNFFVASFTATGQPRWLQSSFMSTANFLEVRGITVGRGRVLLTGGFSQMLHVGPTMLMTGGPGDGDCYVVALKATDGSAIRAVQYGSQATALEQGNAIAMEPTGDLMLVGQYSGNAVLAGQAVTGTNGLEAFIARIGPDLTSARWVRTAQGPNYTDFAAALTLDAAGNAYVCGSFMNELQFSNGGPRLTGNAPNDQDAWVAKFAPTGTVAYALKAGAGQFSVDGAFGVAADGQGHVFTTGYLVRQLAIFGSLARCELFGQLDLFVAAINENAGSDPAVFATDAQTGPLDFTLTGQSLLDTWRVEYDGVPVSQFAVASPTQLTVTLPAGAPTSGTLTAYTPRGCATRPLQIAPTAVTDEFPALAGYSIFPNPASTTLQVSGLPRHTHVVLLDMVGHCVRSARVASDGRLTLPISTLAAGWYVLKPEAAPAQRVRVQPAL